MAGAKEIRGKIASIKNTQKITLEMVAGADAQAQTDAGQRAPCEKIARHRDLRQVN